MNIPARLIIFWYPNAVYLFHTLWKNSISLLEEDLAVGLMFRLLFVPMFHDASLVGKGMSFVFRLFRIAIGLGAFFLVSVLIFFVALVWFSLPLTIILSIIFWQSVLVPLLLVLLIGLLLFVKTIFGNSPKKVWQIKDSKDIWQASKLTIKDVDIKKLLQDKEVNFLFSLLEIKKEALDVSLERINDGLIAKVLDLAKKSQAKYISSSYFFVAILSQIPGIDGYLLRLNLTLADFEKALVFLEKKRIAQQTSYLWDDDFAIHHLKGINRGWLSAPTPNLDSISIDLTKTAAKNGFTTFLGRQAVLSQIISILAQRSDKNVLLVGSAGTGKTTIVNHLAKLIISGDAPDALATKRLVQLDMAKLLSFAGNEASLAEKVKNAFEEVKFVQDIIIFIDEIHTLAVGETSNLNLYALLMPYLESNQFQFLGATEPENYAQIIEKNAGFARIFHRVEVIPATIDETIEILESKTIEFAKLQKIETSFKAITKIVEVAQELIYDRVLPDAALALFEECETQPIDGWITTTLVNRITEQKTNVPMADVSQTDRQLLLTLENVIHERFIDQEPAVKLVSNTLRRNATALRDKKRPIGSFLFVGPTGVGKTEFAKTLAEIFFKSKNAFIRFDMTEYQTQDAVSRFIGAENYSGELTEAVKHRPYSLILLDEFEKASPEILNLFLQVLEDGRLTDFSGKTVNFTNTIVIATSNAGSVLIAQGLESGSTLEQLDGPVKNELLKVFRPELVNRFDEVVIFKTLSLEDLQKIVRLKLFEVIAKLKEQGYLVEFTPEVVTEVAKQGFDPVMGARPMRRLIQDTLEANLSKMILENKLIKGQLFKVDLSLLKS